VHAGPIERIHGLAAGHDAADLVAAVVDGQAGVIGASAGYCSTPWRQQRFNSKSAFVRRSFGFQTLGSGPFFIGFASKPAIERTLTW
jgi:hypothetical protein